MGHESQQTILIVNDTPDQLEIMQFLLHQSGYRVLTASNGYEGLKVARRERPLLVVSDVAMPQMDGIELARRINADAELSAIPVLLVSAIRKDTESIVEGLQAGAFDYLEVPYQPSHLLVKVKRLLEVGATERARRESEEKYRALVEQAADGITICDAQGNILEVNARACEIFGYTCEEMVSRNVADFMPAKDLPISPLNFKELLAGETILSERQVRRKDGRLVLLEISAKMLEDGRLQAIVRDITERRQAEQMRAQLAAIVECSDDAIISKTLNGVITSWNNGAERIYGYSAEEAIGLPIYLIVPADRGDEVEQMLEKIRSRKSVKNFETVRQHKDGRLIDVSITISPIKDGSGNITGAAMIARDITERKQAEDKLRREALVFESISDGVLITDLEGRIIDLNPAAERIFGYTKEEMLGMRPTTFQDTTAKGESGDERIATVLREGRWVGELPFVRKDGSKGVAEVSIVLQRDAQGNPAALIEVNRDITERKRAEEALHESEATLYGIFEFAPDAMMVVDEKGRIVRTNEQAEKMFGYWREEMLNQSIEILLPDRFRENHREHRTNYYSELRPRQMGVNMDLYGRRKDGTEFPVDIMLSPIKRGQSRMVIATIRDITERKQGEEQLRHDAFHDALTDLPNRALFADHLRLAIERAKRHPDHLIAVMFLDLDRFKIVNDSLGHEAGDNLLIAAAKRLRAILRPEDTVARLGGDEFAVLLDSIEGLSHSLHVAERIERELSAPFTLGNRQVFTTASIGIAISSSGYDPPEQLMRKADTAMYRAKSRGPGRHEVFDDDMHAMAVAMLQVETDLHWALKEGQFRLHFQPIISLASGVIISFEALLRWQHPERGLLFPNEFISIAEETGLIVPIGEWVLRESCRQLCAWQKQFPIALPLSINVNVASRQFMQPDFTEQIRNVLQENNLAPEDLKLEITESTLLQHSEVATPVLRQLHELGVGLVTDDFGTGYSSLSYLHRFPIKGLKVDRSFVSQISADEVRREIVRSVVMLAHNLHIDVVAEGVEEKAQFEHLLALQCEYGQGYYFSRPLECAAAQELITKSVH